MFLLATALILNAVTNEVDNDKAGSGMDKSALTYCSAPVYNNYDDYYTEDVLSKSGGVNYYGEQKETYYNLNMSRVVENAKNAGIEGEYWVRDDGVKMYGEYVIVAANQDTHPYGSTVDTSLGEAIVLDTGDFANSNATQVDVAVDW